MLSLKMLLLHEAAQEAFDIIPSLSPHYARGIWKRASILWLGQPSALIRHENGAFWGRFQTRGI